MRKNLEHIEKYKVSGDLIAEGYAMYNIPVKSKSYSVIVTCDFIDGEDVLHVSVANRTYLPTWEVMCYMKDLFFDEEEEAYQVHPKKSEYVNLHKNCLHLWNRVSNNKYEEDEC